VLGGPQSRSRTLPIEIFVHRRSEHALLKVRDLGEGMPPQVQQRVLARLAASGVWARWLRRSSRLT
jgi:sensor histidine kinase regulating citrate/malate metabolism